MTWLGGLDQMIGKKLKKLREAYGITQQRLATYMNVSVREVEEWEQNRKEPRLQQIQTLAELFEVSVDEFLQEEDSSPSKKQPRTSQETDKGKRGSKGKTKKKTKNKTKYKMKNGKKVVKKRMNWPIVLLIIVLLLALGGGGYYVYWKYGDEYFIGKKNDYKIDEMVGTFTAEESHDTTTPVLLLQSDETFQLQASDCNAESTIQGTWSMDGRTMTLEDYSGNRYTFQISSSNKLKYTSASFGCAPLKNDVFTRGTLPDQGDADEEPKEEETSTLTTGQWSGSHSTLVVSSVDDDKMTFTLTSIDSEDASHTATISNVTGSIRKNTVSFAYSDDGYGNAGNGTIIFDETTAVFSITKTTSNPDAAWGLLETGTLYK